MEWLPQTRLGWQNGWLLVAVLYAVFGLLLIIFPRPVVKRLYERRGWTRRDYWRRLLALVLMIAWFALVILTPITWTGLVFWLGFLIYLLGFAGFVLALFNYRAAPLDGPVTAGLYRYSRHPQIVSLLLAFIGVSLTIASWPALLLMLVAAAPMMHLRVLAEERACLEQYGDAYQAYMEAIPRYFFF